MLDILFDSLINNRNKQDTAETILRAESFLNRAKQDLITGKHVAAWSWLSTMCIQTLTAKFHEYNSVRVLEVPMRNGNSREVYVYRYNNYNTSNSKTLECVFVRPYDLITFRNRKKSVKYFNMIDPSNSNFTRVKLIEASEDSDTIFLERK